MDDDRRRVVVTGAGAVSPLGLTAAESWEGLLAGRSGAGRIAAFDPGDFPVQIAAEVKGFDAAAVFGRRRARHLDRFSQFALVATQEALAQSGLDVGADPFRVGVVFGSGIGGITTLEQQINLMRDEAPDRVSPYLPPMMIPNMAAGEIAMETGAMGPNSCTVTACAASATAIGDAYELIRSGRADAVVAGGAEAVITPICIAGFAAMKALSTRNAEPERASRPFDVCRDGFVCGEGAAALVLEERSAALGRGAAVLGELVGYGASCDAYHQTAPHPTGAGAKHAIRQALATSGAAPEEVGYVNAHGTSTPFNDRIESLAVKEVLGAGVAMSSTKSMTGHMIGAAGAFEAFVCLKVLETGMAPPTINYELPDPDCDLDYIANHARPVRTDLVLSNSFGFGGHNVTLAFRRHA
jgi:3-oxoacyl-[acyl-carrier-protein] synthase II